MQAYRKTFLLIALFWSAIVFQAFAQQQPIRIETGLLTGTTTSDGVRVYKGIPFAAAPVGDLRWRAPQPPVKWEEVRKADQFSAACVQFLGRSRPPWTEEFMVQESASEDCLCLNVWTNAKRANAKLPVLVYIHGGGYQEGSGAVAVYDGGELAKKGLVVVTINYRMGVFGFLALPELSRESGHNSSGNYGMLDQVAALQWVRKNIAAFGGDPARVTIAGQSAGAGSVHNLTASPLAKGLFHRAIAESGSGLTGIPMSTLAEAEKAGARFLEASGATSLQSLRALSADDLLKVAREPRTPPIPFRPNVDEWFLPADIATIYREGNQNDVPILTGLTADEGSSAPAYGKIKAEDFARQSRDRHKEMAETFLQLYPSDTPERSSLSQKQSARERGMASMYLWAVERVKHTKAKLFTYYFSRGIPWPQNPQYGAFHTGEVPYVFGTLNSLQRPWEPVDRKLAQTMMSYWANFAATGDPNGKSLPRWAQFDPELKTTMELGEKIGPRSLMEPSHLSFWEKYFASPLSRSAPMF